MKIRYCFSLVWMGVLCILSSCEKSSTGSNQDLFNISDEIVINPNYLWAGNLKDATVIAGSDGVLMMSRSSCLDWKAIKIPDTRAIFDVADNSSKDEMILAGEKGLLGKLNHQQQWQSAQIDTDEDLRNLVFLQKANSWLVAASGGSIYQSRDAITWNRSAISDAAEIRRVKTFDTVDTAIAVGTKGFVAFLNQDANWINDSLPTDADVTDAIAAQDQLIVITNDGAAWSKNAAGQWLRNEVGNKNLYLTQIHFSKASEKFFVVTSSGEIYLSDDRSKHWALVYSGSEPINRLEYFDQLDVWVAAADQGVLVVSADGGNTWERQRLHSQISFEAVSLQGDCLMAVGGGGAMAISWDQGQSWKLVKDPMPQVIQSLNSVKLNSEIYAVGSKGLLAFSANDGRHWKNPAQENYSQDYFFSSVISSDSSVIATGPPGTIIRSTDGGKTWKPTLVLNDYSKGYFHKLIAGKNGQVMAIAGPGVDYYSSDNGLNWRAMEAEEERPHFFNGTYVPSLDRFIAVGDQGNLVVYHVGDIFSRTTLNSSERFQAIINIDSRVIAAGVSGSIFLSEDGGSTWKSVISLHGESLLYLTYLDNQNLILATGAKGALFKSSDKGATWSRVTSPSRSNLRGAVASKNGTIFISSRSGEILVSKNGGESFSVMANPTSMSLRGIHIADEWLFAYGERLVRLPMPE